MDPGGVTGRVALHRRFFFGSLVPTGLSTSARTMSTPWSAIRVTLAPKRVPPERFPGIWFSFRSHVQPEGRQEQEQC